LAYIGNSINKKSLQYKAVQKTHDKVMKI